MSSSKPNHCSSHDAVSTALRACLLALAVATHILLAGCDQRTAAVKELDRNGAAVGIMALQWPKVVTRNSGFVVTVAVRNIGNQTIPALASQAGTLKVNVTYHWKTSDRVEVWDGLLTPLNKDLAVGAEETVDVTVRPPPNAGKYILEIDLVQTGAFWFGGVGSQTASMIIDVK